MTRYAIQPYNYPGRWGRPYSISTDKEATLSFARELDEHGNTCRVIVLDTKQVIWDSRKCN